MRRPRLFLREEGRVILDWVLAGGGEGLWLGVGGRGKQGSGWLGDGLVNSKGAGWVCGVWSRYQGYDRVEEAGL